MRGLQAARQKAKKDMTATQRCDGRGVGLDEQSEKKRYMVEKTITISGNKCRVGVS